MFCVKDQDLFGYSNKYIAECFITFEEIQRRNDPTEQIHLKLSRPTVTGMTSCANNISIQNINDLIIRSFFRSSLRLR